MPVPNRPVRATRLLPQHVERLPKHMTAPEAVLICINVALTSTEDCAMRPRGLMSAPTRQVPRTCDPWRPWLILVFTARALTKTYTSGETQVLACRKLDLEIAAGEMVVLLGPSGSGKSILLNIMGGLDHATSGQLFFRDQELTNLDDRGLTAYRRQHVGFVFQFYNLIPSLTAYENVALVTEISDHPMRPEEALALVGLEPRMHHFPAQLSGGEQQRVAIARAIANARTCCFATSRQARWIPRQASG